MTANMRLLDLERIEVVKGPSTALYGRSAFSGAVNYITKRPSDEFSAEISADVDEHDSLDLRLMVSGPLSENFSARVNAFSYETDGWYTNEIDDQSDRTVNRNYQGNYERLVKVKNRYDPTNLFRLNANIKPTV